MTIETYQGEKVKIIGNIIDQNGKTLSRCERYTTLKEEEYEYRLILIIKSTQDL